MEISAEDQPFLAATRQWFKIDFVPKMSRVLLRHPEFGRPYGRASRRAMTDGALKRAQKEMIVSIVAVREAFTKEVLAFAASMTAKSDYGVDFHLCEARRFGLTDQGLTEAVEVVQLFNTVTKIADALRLQPDFNPRSQP